MTDISGFGLSAALIASNTYPTGFTIDQFADDTDPFDLPELKIAEAAMGLNGDLITWSRAMPLMVNVAVINGSTADVNLSIVHEANRVGRGKVSAQDVINITAVYPNGATISLTNGKMTDGMPGSSVSSNGRQKTKIYKFVFQNITKTSPAVA